MPGDLCSTPGRPLFHNRCFHLVLARLVQRLHSDAFFGRNIACSWRSSRDGQARHIVSIPNQPTWTVWTSQKKSSGRFWVQHGSTGFTLQETSASYLRRQVPRGLWNPLAVPRAQGFSWSTNWHRRNSGSHVRLGKGFKWETCWDNLEAFVNMGVSLNGGTPKSSILIGFSIINHPFWGTTIFGNTHISACSKLSLRSWSKLSLRSWCRHWIYFVNRFLRQIFVKS